MLVIVGFIIVIVGVIGGYLLEGGQLMVLFQPAELVIIGGAALGAMIVSAPPSLLKKIFKRIIASFLPGKKKMNRKFFQDTLNLMYELFQKARNDGLISIESHVEEPEKSTVFAKYPDVLKNKTVTCFITDTLRLMIVGNISPHDLETLMENDAETHHHIGMRPVMILTKIGDSLPGLGIVAAVLGIIITMGAINGPPEEVGHKVAAALVGTFLGVLLSYGFIQPLATNIEVENEDEARIFEVIKGGLVAFAGGQHPLYALEFARRTIADEYRPSFAEMEEAIKNGSKAPEDVPIPTDEQ